MLTTNFMKPISLKLSEEQIKILKKRKKDTGAPISFQIREAIQKYIMEGENKK